jgi:hypothetical protein
MARFSLGIACQMVLSFVTEVSLRTRNYSSLYASKIKTKGFGQIWEKLNNTSAELLAKLNWELS